MERDVIVVGAGPGGATAATILAQKGYDVLLLDRQKFPRDKTCGDAVPAGAIRIMHELGMKEKIRKAVERGEFYPLQQMRLVSPKNYMVEARFKEEPDGISSYVAPRMYYDAVIQQHAVDSGAEFHQAKVKEPIVENGSVTGVRARVNGDVKEFRSHLVIGADGVTSVIARSLRPKKAQPADGHRAVALRAYLEGIEEIPHEVEFYLYQEILPGYAWIFPTGNGQANIGLGMRLDHFRKAKKRLEGMLQTFLEMPAVKKRLKPGFELRDVATWQLNFGSQQKELQHAFNGALLVGDAAGFINPLTGGGIHNALLSAEFASQTAVQALQKGDTSRATLQIYEQRCHEAMWRTMRRSYFIQRWLMRLPFLIDFIIKRAGENSQLAKIFLTKL